MDTPLSVNHWSSSINAPTNASPATHIMTTTGSVMGILDSQQAPPLPTYQFVDMTAASSAVPRYSEKGGEDAKQPLAPGVVHQRHRQYAVDQQLFLEGEISTLSESGSGSKFSNNATLPNAGAAMLHSPTATFTPLATPFMGGNALQQPNFFSNNATTPTSVSTSTQSFAPPPVQCAFSPPSAANTSVPSLAASGGDDEQLSSTNIFVSHLPSFIDDVALRNLFARFGPIVSSVVMRDIYSGVSRGIAFVEFELESSAAEAISNLDKLVIDDKTISVQRGKRFSRGAPTSRVFIRNIPKTVTEAELYDVCSKFGDVSWLSLHADSMRHTGGAGGAPVGGSPGDLAAMASLESQTPSPSHFPSHSSSTNAQVGASPIILGGVPAAGKQDRNIAFVTFASKEAASAAAVSLHNASPFTGADGVPLLTKVVLDNLPPRRQRKASAPVTSPGSAAANNVHPQGQQRLQQFPPPGMMGTAMPSPHMFMSHHQHHTAPMLPHTFQPSSMHAAMLPPQGTFQHHSSPPHLQNHAGAFMLMPDGTQVMAAHSPQALTFIPQHHQHQHQHFSNGLSSPHTTASGAPLFMASPSPSHQFVFATVPPGQQQPQYHLQGTPTGATMHQQQFHHIPAAYAMAQPQPTHRAPSGEASWSSSLVLDAQQQLQQQQLFSGSSSGSGVPPAHGNNSSSAAIVLSPPSDVMTPQHLMYWNASALM